MRALLASLVLVTASAHAADAVKLELHADDRMVYSKKSFEVVEGQKVTIVFKNTSPRGDKSMKHNVVLLKPGTMIVTFAVKCGQAADTGYVPTDKESKEQMVGAIKLTGGGQTNSMTFTAGEPGEYPFFCSSPGHFDKMQGKLIVKAK